MLSEKALGSVWTVDRCERMMAGELEAGGGTRRISVVAGWLKRHVVASNGYDPNAYVICDGKGGVPTDWRWSLT
jgi:hypothetical protein